MSLRDCFQSRLSSGEPGYGSSVVQFIPGSPLRVNRATASPASLRGMAPMLPVDVGAWDQGRPESAGFASGIEIGRKKIY